MDQANFTCFWPVHTVWNVAYIESYGPVYTPSQEAWLESCPWHRHLEAIAAELTRRVDAERQPLPFAAARIG